ncbi:MAG TPA: NifB/NifX family molybdenum-iron cluster-binding protein, partial [Spirochaetota bacterium]|nr:NifB/NifX family molybdenum-iron cluster-binding protein [Spirochaetota bacterium]
FGDAKSYKIFDVNTEGETYLETMENITVSCIEHDDVHGDPVKAKHVMMLLKEKGVQVLVNRKFGPNIQRIKIRFLPVITRKTNIEDGLLQVKENLLSLEDEYRRGVDRSHVVFT